MKQAIIFILTIVVFNVNSYAQKKEFTLMDIIAFKSVTLKGISIGLAKNGWYYAYKDKTDGGSCEHWYFANNGKISADKAKCFIDFCTSNERIESIFYANPSRNWFQNIQVELSQRNFKLVKVSKEKGNTTVYQYSEPRWFVILMESGNDYYISIRNPKN